MKSRQLCAALCALAVLVWLAPGAVAQDTAARGREILEQHKLTVVTVKIVTKIGGFMEQDMSSEVSGTVIDPTGLTVLALSATDPLSMFSEMLAGMGEDMGMAAEVKDVKLLLDDGTEVEAEVVLRDKDLDLAFVRPLKKPEEPMATVSLNDEVEVQILDELIVLNRLGKVARRTYSASIEHVEAIVEKPRKFYIPGADPTQSGLGCPVFSLDGKFVGTAVVRSSKVADPSSLMMGMFGGGGSPMMVIIIPAEDVAEAATQVPEWGAVIEKPAAEEEAEESEEEDEEES